MTQRLNLRVKYSSTPENMNLKSVPWLCLMFVSSIFAEPRGLGALEVTGFKVTRGRSRMKNIERVTRRYCNGRQQQTCSVMVTFILTEYMKCFSLLCEEMQVNIQVATSFQIRVQCIHVTLW